jgi:hypothetical protein
MTAPVSTLQHRFLLDWLRATWLGWLAGIVLTIFAALAGDAVGIRESQALVGAAMGAGVGMLQSRVALTIPASARAWTCASVLGLTAPFWRSICPERPDL